MSFKKYAYAFAASGIHSFLVAGGKVRDAVGASEMVESLATGLLDAVLESLDYDQPQFSRRGGGAFTVVSSDRIQLERLRNLWSLMVRQVLPGLAFQQGLGEGEDEYLAIANAIKRAERDPNSFQPHIPQAGPLTERNPRTGWPATTLKKYDTGHEFLDPATKAKRHFDFSRGERLYNRVTPQRENGCDPWKWPVLLYADEAHEVDRVGQKEQANLILPYKGENHYVAAIHADGNGMGGILAELARNGPKAPGAYPGLMKDFSEAVSRAVEVAAKEAVAILIPEAVDDVLPGRPILLGGDDFSMIVRADLALDFTQVFLQAFERQSGAQLRELAKKYPATPFPQQLTACAGIAFFKARQPFGMAFELAGSLCDYAKKRVRKCSNFHENGNVPSAVAFHRIGSSVFHDYENILKSEMTVAGDPPMRLTLQPYGVGETLQGLPKLADLARLASFMNIKEVRSGHARQLLTLLRRNRAEAVKRYGRWRENLDPKRNKKALKGEVLNKFDAYLTKLGCPEPKTFPELEDVDGVSATPLGDVMALLAMGAESE
ncbi:MAG: hypothetical protein HQL07_08050 [Nitrospirae bacterium]|nr:hypothetical protein [Magnetococcales bacterium]HAT51359.1 hypothetical protein [Alphaproteobacteria bacterium]